MQAAFMLEVYARRFYGKDNVISSPDMTQVHGVLPRQRDLCSVELLLIG
jgi:hypothetical protein